MPNENPTMGAILPTVSAEAAGLATTTLGGVLLNLFVFHAVHFPIEQRQHAVSNAVKVALDSVDIAMSKGSEELKKETNELVRGIIKQAEGHARTQLTRRPTDNDKKIN